MASLPATPPARDPARAIAGPANALVVSALVWIVMLLAGLGYSTYLLASGAIDRLPFPAFADGRTVAAIRMIFTVLIVVAQVVTLIGALRMRRLESRRLATAAAVLAVLPCTSACYVLGVPLGIWALVVLARPEVRSAFRS